MERETLKNNFTRDNEMIKLENKISTDQSIYNIVYELKTDELINMFKDIYESLIKLNFLLFKNKEFLLDKEERLNFTFEILDKLSEINCVLCNIKSQIYNDNKSICKFIENILKNIKIINDNFRKNIYQDKIELIRINYLCYLNILNNILCDSRSILDIYLYS